MRRFENPYGITGLCYQGEALIGLYISYQKECLMYYLWFITILAIVWSRINWCSGSETVYDMIHGTQTNVIANVVNIFCMYALQVVVEELSE